MKVSLRKMLGRRMCKELHKEIKLEVDGKHVELPPIEGIIILNIMRWVRVSRSKLFFSMVYFSVGARAPTSGVQRRMKSSRSQTIGMGCWRLSESKVSFFAHNHFTANKIFYCDPQQSPQLGAFAIKENKSEFHPRCRPLGPDPEWPPSRHSHCPRKSYQNSYE